MICIDYGNVNKSDECQLKVDTLQSDWVLTKFLAHFLPAVKLGFPISSCSSANSENEDVESWAEQRPAEPQFLFLQITYAGNKLIFMVSH